MTEELRWGSPTATPPFEPFVQPSMVNFLLLLVLISV
jgi:hypothetical protein